MTPLGIAGLAAGPLIQIVGPLIGQAMASGDRAQAEAIIKQAYAELNGVAPPEFEQYVAEQVGPTALANIKTDPKLRAAQTQAMDEFQIVKDSGGHDIADQAVQNKILGKSARTTSAGRNRVLQDFQNRNGLDSGGHLGAQLHNAQADAETNAQVGTDLIGQAGRKAMDAMIARGDLAGKIRGQDYAEDARAAEAADRIAIYNSGARERAREGNNRNKQLGYKNTMDLKKAKADAKLGLGNFYNGQANATQGMWSGVAQGVGSAATGLGSAYQGAADREADRVAYGKPKAGASVSAYTPLTDEDEDPTTWYA